MPEPRFSKPIPTETFIPHIQKLLHEGHTVTISVQGKSMNPFLVENRDQVNLIRPTSAPYPIGSLLLGYEARRKRYVLHRLICIDPENNYILMGDGNLRDSDLIRPTDLIAEVSGFIRKGKHYTTHSTVWKTYSFLWIHLLPLRRWLLFIWRKSRFLSLTYR